jgi:hypothetical protein
MVDDARRKPKRRGTFRVVAIFLAVVAALASLEFYALWSSNQRHMPLPAPVSEGPPARP